MQTNFRSTGGTRYARIAGTKAETLDLSVVHIPMHPQHLE